jgi:hypothetical protein
MDKEFQLQAPSLAQAAEVIDLGYAAQSVVQGSVQPQKVFSPELTVATTSELGGTLHDNTKHLTYNSTDYLQCRHQHNVLTGSFTSPVYDLTSSVRRLIYVSADTVVSGIAATWDGQLPLELTGSDLITNGDFSNWTGDDADDWTELNCDTSEEVSGQSGSACKITTSAAAGNISQSITVSAGVWYRLDGYYKNDAGSTFGYAVKDATNSFWIRPSGQSEDDNTTFTAFSYLFKAPTGCSSITIYLGGQGSGDVVYVDTISCKSIDQPGEGDPLTASATWDSIDVDTRTWNEIFDTQSAPVVNVRLYYGNADPPTSYVDRMEILSAIVTARYYKVVITITDPTNEIYAYYQNYTLKFCST